MGIATLTRFTVTNAAAAVAALVAAVGCAGPAGEAPPAPSPAASAPASPPAALSPPGVPGYRYEDPADVCHRFAAALFSADTTVDGGPTDGQLRAAGYADAALAATLVRPTVDGRWPLWREHRARLHTQVRGHADSEAPVDSTVAAYRAVLVAATPVGVHGWRGWTQTTLLHCTLAHVTLAGVGAQWRVAGYTLAPLPGAP